MTAIHFICTGNVYRSRLAEAYCAAQGVAGVRVSSSGIAAGRENLAPISPWAAGALARCGLEAFATKNWQRTTADLIADSDIVVFMEAEHHQFCERWIEPARQRIEIWGVADLGPMPAEEIPAEVERTFALIRGRTDALLASLRRGEA